MHTLQFKPVELAAQRDIVATLHRDYLTWVGEGVQAALGQSVEAWVGMSIAAYVEQTLERICAVQPPDGVFYLVDTHGELAAMVGLNRVSADTAELKRLYVCPPFRGRRFGEACLRRILRDAAEFGYQRVVLDTAPFMYSAQRLYRRCGFVPCAAYPDAEIPAALQARWVFMACDLTELVQVQ